MMRILRMEDTIGVCINASDAARVQKSVYHECCHILAGDSEVTIPFTVAFSSGEDMCTGDS